MEIPRSEAPIRRFFAPNGPLGTFAVTIGDHLWQEDNFGRVLLLSPTGEVARQFGERFPDYAERAFTADRNNHLWLAGDYKYSLDGTRLSEIVVPPGRDIDVDSQGRVVVTGRDTVTWVDAAVRVLHVIRVGSNLGSSVLDARDQVWAIERHNAAVATLIHHVTFDGRVETFRPTNSAISDLQVARDGSVWLGDRDARVLYRMDDTGRIIGAQHLEGAYSALAADPNGALWVGYIDGSGEAVKYEIK